MPQPVGYMERTRKYYKAQGFDKPYEWATFKEVPFAALKKPLSKSRVGLISTAALYDREASAPRFVDSFSTSAPPKRLYANDLSWDKNATHLNDRESYLPLHGLSEAINSGLIAGITPQFHCAPTEYSIRRTMAHDAPELLSRLQRDQADLALRVPL